MDFPVPGHGCNRHRGVVRSSRSRVPTPSVTPGAAMALTALFAISRAIYFAAGIRFDMVTRSPSQYPWQLLGSGLLQHHLLVSVWHLDSQPPLFNLFTGLLLKVPYGMQQPIAVLIFLGLGLSIVVLSYAVMLGFGVWPWLSFGIALFIIVNPSYVLYENWLSYAYPTVALLVASVWFLQRYLRTRLIGWGFGFFLTVVLVFLMNSTYQLPWLLGATAVVLVTVRRWRSVLLAAALPLLVAVLWLANDVAQFGTVATSSWLGMNLAKTTLLTDFFDQQDIKDLVRHHVLTPIAEVAPFSPVRVYVPRYSPPPRTGTTALDAPSFANETHPNFNNLVYVDVSKQYLHDDLAFIKARPAKYARAVLDAVKVWNVPSDEYFAVAGNRRHVTDWADWFDRTILLRPAANASAITVAKYYFDDQPALIQLSVTTVLVNGVNLLGLPIVVLARWRRDRAWAGSLGYVWMTILYAFAVTSLVELGENQRFAMELAPLPLVGLAVVVSYAFGGRRSRWT